ncbi:hypothetical protein BV497_08415 [Fulvimonas soli]|nr:hypothetical protein BV497_08415 [Fulvimonas soli]
MNHQEIVKKILDAKAVDFQAIGKTVAELGPAASLADEPWDVFCGTMRTFIRLYVLDTPGGFGEIERLAGLRNVAGELER